MVERNFFQIGSSVSGQVDEDLVNVVNKNISDLNLDRFGISFYRGSQTPSTMANVGSARNVASNIFGFISSPEVANAKLHPSALPSGGLMSATSSNLAEHGISINALDSFLTAENFNLPNGVQAHTFEALTFNSGFFNRQTLEATGHSDEIVKQVRPLRTALHEIGHTVSRGSGNAAQVRSANEMFGRSSANASDLTTNFLELARQNALEEARAETFSYHALGRTEAGQQYKQFLGSADLTQDITSPAMRANTFSGTTYYHYNDFQKGFSGYTQLDQVDDQILRSVGVNVEDLTLRANIVSAGTFLGATDFGEYSQHFDPLRDDLISTNREYISRTHGQEYVDLFDESLARQSDRFSVGFIEDTPIAQAPTEQVSDAGRRGPIGVGTPAEDIRTAPSPRGSDSAAGRTGAATANQEAKIAAEKKARDQVTKEAEKRAKRRGSLLNKGLKTAEDLASGNARAMGIAAAGALLLGAGHYARDRNSRR